MNGMAVLAGWALRAFTRDCTEKERLKQFHGSSFACACRVCRRIGQAVSRARQVQRYAGCED